MAVLYNLRKEKGAFIFFKRKTKLLNIRSHQGQRQREKRKENGERENMREKERRRVSH